MKIIFSVEPVCFPLTGIGRYTWELAHHLPLQPAIDSLIYFTGNEFISELKQPSESSDQHYKLKQLIKKSRLLTKAYRLLMPKLKQHALIGKEDHLFHGTNFLLPPFAGKKVATFHDLSVYTWSECHPSERVRFMQQEIPKTLMEADALIVDAEYTRQELANYFAYPLDKIHTVHLAPSKQFKPHSRQETEAILSLYGLEYNHYCFYAGTIEPRKNLLTLLSAYERLPQAVRQYFPLVLSGYKGWKSEDIHSRIERAARDGWVKYLGYTSADHLPALYAGARLFTFPSLYEGFGLPVLEAMSAGVPVVCSNSSTLPEVAGGAALLVDPQDVEAWTQALQQGLNDETWRMQAIQQGLVRAKQFSWNRCAAETLSVYQRV